MKTLLTVLLVLILAAEAIVWFQMRKLINSWEKEVEKEDILHKCCDLLLEKEKIGQEEFEALFER